jgi:ELWxxDGT repeat protein
LGSLYLPFGSDRLFVANDGLHGYEVWKTDGTAGGTTLVADVYPGAGSSNPQSAVVAGSDVFFVANDGTASSRLVVSDGTPAGTYSVTDGLNSVFGPMDAGGAVVFSGTRLVTPPNIFATQLYTVGSLLDGCLPVPRDDCKEAVAGGKASLLLKDGSAPAKDLLKFKSAVAEATFKPEFGSPTTTTDYRLCLYEGGSIFLGAGVPAGAGWSESSSGFKFKGESSDGLTQVSLKANASPGRAKIGVKGKGAGLALPALGGILSPVTAQLINDESGACWTATFSAPFKKDDLTQFNDKSD